MPDKRKHIALVTTWFPPVSGVAVNRMSAFVKYLDKEKFRISVITLSHPDAPGKETVNQADVYRVKNAFPLQRLSEIPGEPRWKHSMKVLWNYSYSLLFRLDHPGWIRGAADCLEQVNSLHKIDLVLSSFAPVEAHLASLRFLSRHSGIRWIADMRDEMSANPYTRPSLRRFYLKIEKQIAARAQAITTVSQPILEDFRKLMPPVNQFEEIRNGFDHEQEPDFTFNPVFTIVYSGSFYGERKPDFFLKALENFLSAGKTQVRLKFLGSNRNFNIPPSLTSLCEFIPQMPYPEAIRTIARADALLFIQPTRERKGVFTGKLFDYISVCKPIIAACDLDDVAAGLIRETQSGFLADFYDEKAIESAIGQAYDLWKNKSRLSVDPNKIRQLHRKHQVKKLEQLIEKNLTS